MSSQTDRPPVRFWSVDDIEALDFDPAMQEMLDDGGLARIRMPYGEGDAWVATKYEDVRLVTTDPRFSRAELAGRDVTRLAPHFIPLDDAVGFTDPPYHTGLRKTVAKMFTRRRVEQLRPRAEKIAEDLLDAMEQAGAPANVMEHLNTPLSVAGISELMGVPQEDWSRILDWTLLVISSAQGRRRSEQAKEEIGTYFDALATQRMAEPRDDVLSDMAAAERDGQLSRKELVAFAVLMEVSGINSVRFNSANMVYLLLTHPEHHARLLAEPDLLPQAVEELLRFIPHRNAVGMGRIATEDVQVGEVTVCRGEPVYASYVAANRDPEKFDNPHSLDFDRAFNPHLAFGNGPHYCAGPWLARMEMQVMLRGLLDRFPDLRLAVPPSDIRWRQGELIRGPVAIPVTW
ncbi:cytochrome P450 [Streptomyces sp. NPDC050516]|uniref:cytochrome P450 n=1 Tax=Streptomyces sp. NPDC050516 TaxID=3365621 RepID=UPI003791F4A1